MHTMANRQETRRKILQGGSALIAVGATAALFKNLSPVPTSEVPSHSVPGLTTHNPLEQSKYANAQSSEIPVSTNERVMIVNGKPELIKGSMLKQPLDDHYRSVAERIPGTTEFTGKFPEDRFTFSDEIKRSGLVPSVFLNEPTSRRVEMAANYIRSLASLLGSNPHIPNPDLAGLKINDLANFPIDLPPNATLKDILKRFADDYMLGNIRFISQPIVGANFHLGTIGHPTLKTGKWVMKSDISFNSRVTDEIAVLEENGLSYYQTTNLQLGLKFLHEYSHYLQDEALVKLIMQDRSLLMSIGQDPEKMRAEIVNRAMAHNQRVAASVNLTQMNTSPNEAQANAVSQLFLDTLTKINRTDRFPGAEDDDPYPISSQSLLRNFREYVQKSSALDPAWILRHSNWGQ